MLEYNLGSRILRGSTPQTSPRSIRMTLVKSSNFRPPKYSYEDGGFALKNFMPTNAGKLESLFDVETAIIGEGGFGSVRKGKDLPDYSRESGVLRFLDIATNWP